MVNRGVVGAHYGLRDWLVQRLTAGIMALYSVSFAVCLLLQTRGGYEGWAGLFSGTVSRSFALLFLLSLFYHAWFGVRDIVMDYVKLDGVRLLIHVLVILALLLYAIWSVQILWGM